MRKSVTQEFEYGCGIACYAFALNISYKDAVAILGSKQATSTRFWIKDLTSALTSAGLGYAYRYVPPNHENLNCTENSIVLIRRSKTYPSGHYLIKHNGKWMDPWINLAESKNITQAKSGFRLELPGSAMYVIEPKPAER